ncbi:chalcone isomerase-like protein 1 [Elaeis guineensis]|uniref:Chalcone--flavanone isomerase n=1 Tax=Elaeis guineensis var. tenera TaxID=51953 RepID=A0A6I9RNV4_ELAGV|nr:fatty-acid-binding protein 1 [Elaeis guineensis]
MATVLKEEAFEKEESLKVAEMEKMVKGEKAEEGKEEKAVEEVRAKLEQHKVEEAKVVVEGDQKAKGKEEVGENVKMDIEPKTGVSFPVKLGDGQQLNAVGCRKKKILGLGVNIYAFGIYADNAMLKELLKTKFSKNPENPTKELYEAVIDSDISMTVRLVLVFRGLTMSLVKKNMDDGLAASIKKLTGGQKNEALTNKIMADADNRIKLPPGSVIEITRLPGYVLQTKVRDELVSKVESELLCRAYFHMYLGDDPFDMEAKERFGKSMLSLF